MVPLWYMHVYTDEHTRNITFAPNYYEMKNEPKTFASSKTEILEVQRFDTARDRK